VKRRAEEAQLLLALGQLALATPPRAGVKTALAGQPVVLAGLLLLGARHLHRGWVVAVGGQAQAARRSGRNAP